MPVRSSVMTVNGVTSEPVPEVVGMATMTAFFRRSGKVQMRFRMSMKRMAISSNLSSGCSYMSHMILAASMGEPPPREMNTSGWKERMESRAA